MTRFNRIAAAFLVAGVPLSAVAATTGNLHLEGRIRDVVAIDVSAVDPSSSLNLTSDAVNLQVAQVKEFSNSQNGYRVTLASKNDGALRNTRKDGVVIREIPYKASYEGQAVKLATQPQEITNHVNVTGKPETFLKSFNISYTGSTEESLPSGTYQDDLVFEISAL
jgi:hypothetical protein